MRRRLIPLVLVLAIAVGIALALLVGGAVGALGGLLALLILLMAAGGLGGYGRAIDRGAGRGRPVSTDFGGEFDRPRSEGDLL